MKIFSCWAWQLLGAVVLVLEPAGSLAPHLGTCKEPPKIPNAFQKSYVGALIPAGTVVKYGCLRGYELMPGTSPGQVTCLQNFTWSEVQNFCQKVRCPNPNITNGVQIPKPRPGENAYEYGDTVSIECNPGYGIKGNINSSALIWCRYDGSWDAAVPVCEPVCDQPQNISHGRHNGWTKKKFFVGASVMYMCDRGYTVVGEPLIYCKAGDGVPANWSHPIPECTEVQCPAPDIEHGRLKSAQNFTYKSTVTVECDAGYVPVGVTTIQCQDNGRWHPREPTCVLGRCPYPPAVDHTDRNPQRDFPVGTTVTYFCRSGYTLLPEVSPKTTCLKNFTWSKIPKLCQKVHCPNPAINHGKEISIRKVEYTFGDRVEFQCDLGYVLKGSQRIQCWSDGMWRPPVPYCDMVCGPPPKINSGRHSGLKTEHFPYGSEVTYRCAEGLSLIGESSIYCTSDDGVNLMWSGPAPECKVVRCPKPVIDNGRMTTQRHTFPYGVAVRFSCNEGYVLHGSNESRCLGDSAWHPPLPTCQPVLCPELQVKNGKLIGTWDGNMRYRTNATLTFECLHGYHFSGDGDMSLADSWTVTCLADGNWTQLPKCKKQDNAAICEEVDDIKAAFECGVPIAEMKTLLEIQKLFLEIQKLKVELGNLQ
ncbi:C4b-binding protein alpha chain-like isoform X1 [Struthio camelus]|uniref:C4b-binding protein alpha chain-like isoform X1 n=1 Tax=Struthio camelus TaxID=8801 RepID=UPI003603BB79